MLNSRFFCLQELLEIQARNEVNKQKSKKMKIDEVTSDMVRMNAHVSFYVKSSW